MFNYFFSSLCCGSSEVAFCRLCRCHADICRLRSCLLLLVCSIGLVASTPSICCNTPGTSVLELALLLFVIHLQVSFGFSRVLGAQITFPYSRIGMTRLEYSFFTVGPSKNVNDLLISASILLALFAINSTCWSNFSSGSSCAPKSLSLVVSPGVALVPLLAITN